jgi:hypothetical protein
MTDDPNTESLSVEDVLTEEDRQDLDDAREPPDEDEDED